MFGSQICQIWQALAFIVHNHKILGENLNNVDPVGHT